MSKKKDLSRLETEKDLSKLMKEIQKQDFKSDEELNDFMKNLMGNTGSFDNLPKSTGKKERSQDLVYEAYEQTATKGKKLIKKALELDPNNADAYNYLASIEKNIDKVIIQYKKAVKAGEKTLGKKFLKEEKGYFWGMIETRPYMRAKVGLANCLGVINEVDKAIEIYEELLELNPNDNQGVRYLLLVLLLSKKNLSKFELFMQNNEEENSAVWNYSNALYSYKKNGKTTKANKILLNAFKNNKFVIDYLLGKKKMPNELPQYIGFGDENEAVSYVYDAWQIWDDSEGAFDWLYEFKQERLKMN